MQCEPHRLHCLNTAPGLPHANHSSTCTSASDQALFQFQFQLHLTSAAMEAAVECAKCECCGLVEDCTRDYILGVRAAFGGRWLCGLCSEAVRDEVARGTTTKQRGPAAAAAAARLEEALRDHMAFCGKCRRSPAFRVADGMRQMLRRCSK
ncbi:hypothetical protein GQ55_9G606600 [Panicum hallii var. hallii]|uniref:DUF1677 family protein n=1 Tax=Panicum hallii var. hallii TaxID=1504633 RepID=A0A2T7CHB2_9POAL|nr:hypothetical protein GQ55_9G606600 [Panicum hallii var. hallii]